MKILYVTTVGITMRFFKNFIKDLIDCGHIVDIATNETEFKVSDEYVQWGCNIYHLSTSRSPLNTGNIKAVKELRKIVETGKYDIVHCHTPVAAACTRLACRKARKNGTRVIYTAHGFHFYKGAPKANWMLFYPVEKLCAKWTDLLITINREDHTLAKEKLKAKRIEYVPGVGIDLDKFVKAELDVAAKRREVGIPLDAKLLLSVGELNANKNHETVIKAIADNDQLYYIIAGEGEKREAIIALVEELKVSDRVKLLGFRNDIRELCAAADIFAFPSFREGLSVALMEAMASGLPCVVSRIRGNVDLIDENGGALFMPSSEIECKKAIEQVLSSNGKELGAYNAEKVKQFSYEKVLSQMKELYGV